MLPLLKRRPRTLLITLLILTMLWLVVFGGQLYHAGRQLLDTPQPPANQQPWFLEALDAYGLPLVFGVVVVAAAGVPFPVTLLLVAAGASAAEGQRSIAWVVAVGLVAAVAGDHLGYLIGRIGGGWLLQRIGRVLQREEQLGRAQDTVHRRGGAAVFLSRWLLLPLGSPCNWICGSLGYPLRRFFVADVLGQLCYVALCVGLGVLFSAQIAGISSLIGKAGLWMVGLGVALLLGARLLRKAVTSDAAAEPPAGGGALNSKA